MNYNVGHDAQTCKQHCFSNKGERSKRHSREHMWEQSVLKQISFLRLRLKFVLPAVKDCTLLIRDQPFNLKGGLWFFVSLRKKISDNTRVRIFISFVAQFFFPEFNIRLYVKTLNQICYNFLNCVHQIHTKKSLFYEQHTPF